jgi:hypothetical protein
VNPFIDHCKDELHEVKSDSQETQLFEVPRCFLGETNGFVTQFVQVHGICEWDDRQSENLIIAMEMMEQMINHKINRKLKHV